MAAGARSRPALSCCPLLHAAPVAVSPPAPRSHRLSHHSAPRSPAVGRAQLTHSWRCATTSRETQEGHGAHGLPSHPQPTAAHPHSRGPALGAAGLATEEKVRRPRAPGRRVCLSCRAAAAMIEDGEPERTRTAGRGRDRKCVTWEWKCTGQRDGGAVALGWLVWNDGDSDLEVSVSVHWSDFVCFNGCSKTFFSFPFYLCILSILVFSCISQYTMCLHCPLHQQRTWS